jgi:pyruvate dehydrogenase E1 component beta subunit
MSKMSYRDAIRSALREALREDPRVFLMGEDVGRYGGAFAVSMGLLEEFGDERIRDTPLAESTYLGAGIGAAMGGMRPIVEIMTVNFSLLALDQVVNNAATLRHMSGGQIEIPLVVRMATGAGKQIAAQHSHSLESWYAHIPGIKVLEPATVQDARDMLLAGLADPDPVFLFEAMALYNLEGDLDEEAEPSDPWRAAVRRPGRDVSLISYGRSLWKCLEAAELLANEGIEAEVVDLRSLRPLDTRAIIATAAKTHRAVVVDEAWRTGSLAAEVSARIMEHAFYELDAPVERVCTVEVPIPYAKHLEDAATPQPDRIAEAARRTMQRGA